MFRNRPTTQLDTDTDTGCVPLYVDCILHSVDIATADKVVYLRRMAAKFRNTAVNATSLALCHAATGNYACVMRALNSL